jgi:hypothetical protein
MASQSELFILEPDDRLERLRNWIGWQWVLACFFWLTESQIVQMAQETRTLCETVIEECSKEFERHCQPEATGHDHSI